MHKSKHEDFNISYITRGWRQPAVQKRMLSLFITCCSLAFGIAIVVTVFKEV